MKKLTLSRNEKLLFVFPCLILALPFVVSAFKADKLDAAIAKFREPNSVDCGRVSETETGNKRMSACVTQAYKARKPFQLRYESFEPNTKTYTAIAWVGKSDGTIYRLVQDRKAWRRPHRVEVSVRKAQVIALKNGSQTLKFTQDIIPLPDFE